MAAKKQKGLGDTIAAITEAVGVKPCDGCLSRKDWLNINFPYHRPRHLTEDEKIEITTNPREVYNTVFGTNIEADQFKGGVESSIIKKLEKLKTYEN